MGKKEVSKERVCCPFCDMPVKHYHTTKKDKWYRCILCLIKFSVSREEGTSHES